MALTAAAANAGLDAALSGVTHVEWSENGSTVSAKVAATAITLEAANDQGAYQRKGIDVASPPLLSAGASAAGTITHYRLTTAASGGTAKTRWTQLRDGGGTPAPITLALGEKISLTDAAIGERYTPGA